MSKYTNGAKKTSKSAKSIAEVKQAEAATVRSFEGGVNYRINPLRTLEFILASSIFSEPSFYESANKRTSETIEAINAALDYDFAGTLTLAGKIRNQAWMRLNPQVIAVHAAMHPNRAKYTASHAGAFALLEEKIALRPDDLTTQIEYYIHLKGSKKGLPGILKRAIAHRLGQFDRYRIGKYANRGIGLVDLARIVHAKNDHVSALMRGELVLEESELTWKTLKSAGKSWSDILKSGITLSHQDMLFNLRGIAQEVSRSELEQMLKRFVAGAGRSMVFPYRYFVAATAIKESYFANQDLVLNALELAMRESFIYGAKLQGKTAILADNSGSMNRSMNVDKQNMTFRQLANISAILAAAQSDQAVIVPFATHMRRMSFTNQGLLSQVEQLSAVGDSLGGSTDMTQFFNGILQTREHFDHILVYSDLQVLPNVNPDRLYGNGAVSDEVQNVWGLMKQYRKRVNPRATLFICQVAGYDNSVVPDIADPLTINMSGWTGKEITYVAEISRLWAESAI